MQKKFSTFENIIPNPAQHQTEIKYLTTRNKHFQDLVDKYCQIESEIRCTEEYVLNTYYAEDLKNQLKALKNEIYKMVIYNKN